MHIIAIIDIIGKTQGPFCTVQLFGTGAHQVQGCGAGFLQSVSVEMFYGSRRMDPIMIRPQGINNGAFVVSPDTVWYASVLLLFSASAMTDTGSKSFDCAFVSTLETYDDPENGNYLYYTHYCNYCHYLHLFAL
jgi:hypothetical protein